MGIADQVATMALAEKRELAEAVRRAIVEDLAASARGEPDRRPRCSRLDWFCWVRAAQIQREGSQGSPVRPRGGGALRLHARLTHLGSRPFMSCVNGWTIGERYGNVSTLV